MKFPKLYKLTSSNKVQIWTIYTVKNKIIIVQGQQDGKKQRYEEIIKKGKNIGRANETTAIQQAEAEAKAKWEHKHNKDYHINIKDCKKKVKIANKGGYLPMLAQDFKKHSDRHLKYPCYVQPKLDGCFFRTTSILTNKGTKTIEDIVENKLTVKVLSYNFTTKKLEFKSVTSWFDNGKINYKEWMEILPKYGNPIKCTPNHLFYTNNGWKKAKCLNSNKDKIFNSNCNQYKNQLLAGTLLGDTGIAIDKRYNKKSYRIIFCHTNKEYFDFKVRCLNIEGRITQCITGYGSKGWRYSSRALTQTDFPIKKFFWIGHSKNIGKRKLLTYRTLIKYITPEALSLWIADDGSIEFNNKNKYTPRLSLATHNFSDKQINNIIKYFKLKWNCIPSIYHDKRVKSYGRFLTFSTKDTLLILNRLKDYKCRGVEYKYYFKDGKYLNFANFNCKFTSFKKRLSHKMPIATKYDLEVKDNHNYFANGVLVHNCRALATKDNKGVQLWFRSGKEITTMGHIVDDLDLIMKEGDIFDGELYKHGGDFNTFTGAIRANKNLKSEITTKIKYHIYDCPRIVTQLENTSFNRRFSLFDCSLCKYITKVDTIKVYNFAEAIDFYKQCIAKGYEGIMFRNIDMPYEQKRSYNLLKYKEFIDDEFIIIGAEEGKGILAGHIGSFICKIEPNRILKDLAGGIFKFGNIEGRIKAKMEGKQKYLKYLFEHPKEYINKPLTIKYQNLSKEGIPRFPVGKTIRFDK